MIFMYQQIQQHLFFASRSESNIGKVCVWNLQKEGNRKENIFSPRKSNWNFILILLHFPRSLKVVLIFPLFFITKQGKLLSPLFLFLFSPLKTDEELDCGGVRWGYKQIEKYLSNVTGSAKLSMNPEPTSNRAQSYGDSRFPKLVPNPSIVQNSSKRVHIINAHKRKKIHGHTIKKLHQLLH